MWQGSNMTKDLFKEERPGCHLQNFFSVKSLEPEGCTEAAAKTQKPGSLLDPPSCFHHTHPQAHIQGSSEWPRCINLFSVVAPGLTVLVDGFPKRHTWSCHFSVSHPSAASTCLTVKPEFRNMVHTFMWLGFARLFPHLQSPKFQTVNDVSHFHTSASYHVFYS